MQFINKYLSEIQQTLEKVMQTQAEAMEAAAALIADATIEKRNIFAFGCNHAGLLALELYYRSGGMVNINPVRGPGLHLDIDPATMTSQMERLPGYGRMLMDHIPLGKGDVIIIHSVSGRNTVTVDAAIRAREKGASVIALTNLTTSKAVTSRHETGICLYQAADIVIDNCGCLGDASMEIEGVPSRVGPTSTAIGAAILNAIISEAVARVTAAGHEAPVFISANIDGGDKHNQLVLDSYKDQIFYM